MNNVLFGLCWTCAKGCGMCLFEQIIECKNLTEKRILK